MSVIHRHRHEAETRTPPVVAQAGAPAAENHAHDHGPWFDRALATLRIAYGVTFLWAFLDKTFALGFHTGYDQDGVLDRFGPAAWINGGSPTEGFLSFGVPADNPFHGFFTGLAGQAWVDWLFMAGLLGIGVTLLLGVGMRIGAAAGALMYAFMYAASLPAREQPRRRRPPRRHHRDGGPRPGRGRHHLGAGSLVEQAGSGEATPRPALTPGPRRPDASPASGLSGASAPVSRAAPATPGGCRARPARRSPGCRRGRRPAVGRCAARSAGRRRAPPRRRRRPAAPAGRP